MKSVGSYEAKTHLPRLLSQVEKGETITITKRGKPIAVFVTCPGMRSQNRTYQPVITQFRAYSKEQARKHGSLTAREIKENVVRGGTALSTKKKTARATQRRPGD